MTTAFTIAAIAREEDQRAWRRFQRQEVVRGSLRMLSAQGIVAGVTLALVWLVV